MWGFPGGSVIKESSCNAGVDSIPGSGRSPGGGNSNPLQYSCLENPMDSGDWRATVHMGHKSWTQLINWAGTHSFTRWEEPQRQKQKKKAIWWLRQRWSFASCKPRNTKDPEFPFGLVVRIWCFHCRGLGSLDPSLETVRHVVQCSQNIKTNHSPTKKKKKKTSPRIYSNDQQLGKGKERSPRAFR